VILRLSRFASGFRFTGRPAIPLGWSRIMSNRSFRLSLLIFAVVIGCETDDVFKPMLPVPAPQFTTLRISPSDYTLSTVAPGNTVQLGILAYDRAGLPLPVTGTATYSSSGPAIASVGPGGLVTAASPGSAVITAALTLGGVTRTASMTVSVQTIDYSDATGVYDVTARITSFDPAWGDLNGYRYEAVLTLSEVSGPPWLQGTYRVLRLISPMSDSVAMTDAGTVTPFYFGSRLVIALGEQHTYGLSLIVATLDSGLIDGTFGCCGHISGTFEARRRP
jgi:hypothetical protein